MSEDIEFLDELPPGVELVSSEGTSVNHPLVALLDEGTCQIGYLRGVTAESILGEARTRRLRSDLQMLRQSLATNFACGKAVLTRGPYGDVYIPADYDQRVAAKLTEYRDS